MSSEGQQDSAEQAPGSVLVVDDNPLISTVLRSLFHNAGFRVHIATDGEEALSVLAREAVDVIVCDVMMPRMDGYEFHERVRERGECAHIPFIFLTALSDDSEMKRGLLSGADQYLTKPFDPAAMVPLLQGKVIRSRTLKASADHQFNTFRKKVVNTLSHEFRTPLVAITTGSELLMDHSGSLDSGRVQNLIEAIRRGGVRLERLVNDFMLLQQLELGVGRRMFDARGKVSPLKPLIERVAKARFDELTSQGFTCELDLSLEGVELFVYAPHIEDLMLRLIDNAAKFSRERKEILITGRATEEEVVLSILDRGVGVDLSKTDLSLDLFGQVDREKWEQQGTGMGLALVRRYLEILKGHLELQVREGGGTVAHITLPRTFTAP